MIAALRFSNSFFFRYVLKWLCFLFFIYMGTGYTQIIKSSDHTKKVPTSAQKSVDFEPYLSYYRLKPTLLALAKEATKNQDYPSLDKEIQNLIERYPNLALSDQLRSNWLMIIGKRGDWPLFQKVYAQSINRNQQIECYKLNADLYLAQKDPTHIAQRAWQKLKQKQIFGEGCIELIKTLKITGIFSDEQLWSLIQRAYQYRRITIGKSLAEVLSHRPAERLLNQANENPTSLIQQFTHHPKKIPNEIAILALTRSAATDPSKAAHYFSAIKKHFTPVQQQRIWNTFAYQAATHLKPQAQHWYALGNREFQTEYEQEWHVRSAVRAQDWRLVHNSIQQMPNSLKKNRIWIYWNAYALKQQGASDQARLDFESIADPYHYYGQLARKVLDHTTPSAVFQQDNTLDPAQIDKLIETVSETPGFKIAYKLYLHGLYHEGAREWEWALKGMDDQQLLASAYYAQQLNLYDRVISSAIKIKNNATDQLRYPRFFSDNIEKQAENKKINPDLLYALIREESRFNPKIHSASGAIGLMQLMPSTAHDLARAENILNFSTASLEKIDINIQLGSYYLSKRAQQFKHNLILTLIAYNAGFMRAQKWQNQLPDTGNQLEQAIFIENIPFDETRNYVKNIIASYHLYTQRSLDYRKQEQRK